MTFGLNLLLELCFIFIVQCKSAVMPASLRPWILQEYGKILASLVQSDGSFQKNARCNTKDELEPISDAEFAKYFSQKRRKLNIQMVILLDCIGYPRDLPEQLLKFIELSGEIHEVKAVAFKSLAALQGLNEATIAKAFTDCGSIRVNSPLHNNLFIFWLIHYHQHSTAPQQAYSRSLLVQDITRVSNKIRFLQFIHTYCQQQMLTHSIKDNAYFDPKIFSDTDTIIQQYYKLDDELMLLFNNKGARNKL